MAQKVKTTRKTTSKPQIAPVKVEPTKPNQLNNLSRLVIIKNKRITAIILLLIVLVLALLFVFKGIFIAAMVNGQPISRLSVVKTLEKQAGKTTLESLITKTVILQEAKKRNINVTQNDINQEIGKIEANLKTQQTTLDQALATQGMTKAQLKDEIKIQLSVQKMVDNNVTVTNKEIDDFVTANKAQMTPGTSDSKFRKEATLQLKQQKVQEKTQAFVSSLQAKAKITHFVSY